MKPLDVAKALNRISSKIKSSSKPDRDTVIQDLKNIVSKLARDESMTVSLSTENGNSYFDAIEILLPEAKELLSKVTEGIDEEKEQEILSYLEHEGLDQASIKDSLDSALKIFQALSIANKMLSNKEIDDPQPPEEPAPSYDAKSE